MLHGAFTNSTCQSDDSLFPQNQSESRYNRTLLLELNEQMFLHLMPAVVYLVVLMVFGSVGNSIVVYIFGRRLRSTTQNLLFLWLAVFDLLSCLAGIPSEIVDLRRYYLYEDVVACKTMRFLLTVLSIASVNLLLTIAVDRYRRVCRPLHAQLNVRYAKLCVLVSAVVGVVVAGPAISLYGQRTIRTSVVGLEGCDCSVQDNYQGQLYPLLYEVVFGVAFLTYTVALSAMYLRVWRETRRHRKYMARHSISSIALSSLLRSDGDSDSLPSALTDTPAPSPGQSGRRLDSQLTDSPEVVRRRARTPEISVKILKSLKASKLTVIAFTVTTVFVISYLPHLFLITMRTVIKDFDHRQTRAGLALYNIFLRSYFVNSVVNVFIYSAMNSEFRAECKAVFTRMCRYRKNI